MWTKSFPLRFAPRIGLFAFPAGKVLVTICMGLLILSSACQTQLAPLAGGQSDRDNQPGQTSNPAGQPAPQDFNNGEAAAGAPLSPAGDAAGDAAREIEEADLVKVAGDKIYVLNQYKGLIIVDAANPDAPTVAGSTELRGFPVEMYVVGNRAFVLLSADFGYGYAYAEGASPPSELSVAPPQPEFTGSQVAVVDISDATKPTVLGKINLVGYADQSRRVGDVLYIAGRTLAQYGPGRSSGLVDAAVPIHDDSPRAFIASINVADPEDIKPIDRKTFTGGAVEMQVSQSAIYAASYDYDVDSGQSMTRVQYVDITEPTGNLAIRGQVVVPGWIRNRFYMDEFENIFRICTESTGFGFRKVRMFTYDVSNPDDIQPKGQTDIIQGETLQAVRYDGPRAYVVTFLQVDPLFVLDMSDPAHPAVTGALEVPGFSTHIEPRGDRLIAVGIDDTEGRRPAVAYYDVADPAAPTQLGRVVLGPPGSFTESEAVYDEKAFKIIDDLGLIVIPFSHVSYEDVSPDEPDPQPLPGGGIGGVPGASPAILPGAEINRQRPKCTNAVQLVDFDDQTLQQRGWFDTRGRANRVGVIGSRVFAVSPASLQTVDISDRDEPVALGEAEFHDDIQMAVFSECNGGWIGGEPDVWTDVPPLDPMVVSLIQEVLDVLRGSDLCGTASTLPLAGLIGGMMFMQRSRRRRW